MFLLPVFFLFHGYVAYFPQIPILNLVFPLLQIFAGLLITWLFFWYLIGSFKAAALATFLTLVIFLFFGYIHDMIKAVFPGSMVIGYRIVLPVFIVLIAGLAVFLRKRKPTLTRWMLYLNVLFLVFLVVDSCLLGFKILNDKKANEVVVSSPCSNVSLPDIYLIIADEYSGLQHMRELYQFDNSPFQDSLKYRGFFVANESRSNYDFTPFSVASIMDMDYLKGDKEEIFSGDPAIGFRAIFQNKFVALLKSWGYNFHNYSIFNFEGSFTETPNSLIPAEERLVLSSTLYSRFRKEAWMPLLLKMDSSGAARKLKYENLEYNQKVVKVLGQTAKTREKTPRFIYTHLEMPHFPFYYNKDGIPYSYEALKKDSLQNDQAYLGYLQYANGELLKLADLIVKENQTPPIIILMSDHGRRHYLSVNDPKYRFMNLFSIYIPDRNYSQFNDSVSAVNVFRTLLNNSFCQKMPILPHKEIGAAITFDD